MSHNRIVNDPGKELENHSRKTTINPQIKEILFITLQKGKWYSKTSGKPWNKWLKPKTLASSTLFIFITKSYHFLEIFYISYAFVKMATELVRNKIHEHEIILKRI